MEYLRSITGTLASTVGVKNPIRYRGYYYDVETGLYYLQSRYYDPQTGRFINADDASYIGADGSFASYNLFAYCNNNPVDYYDYTGCYKVSKTKNYFTIAFNEWETNMLLGAIEVGSVAVSAVLAILAAIPSCGLSFPVVGAVLACITCVVATLKYIDYAGGSKGLNFNKSRKWYLPNYIFANKKQPSGFKNIWQVWNAIKNKISKIIKQKSTTLSILKKLANKKSKASICRLARIIIDYINGKKIIKSNY